MADLRIKVSAQVDEKLAKAFKAAQDAPVAGEIIHRGISVKTIRPDTRECDFIASTDAIDSYEESVDQSSWRLDRYKANPVALFAHQSRELPIGKCTRCEVINGQLECTIRFSTEDLNPLAEQVWKNIKGDMLRAVSVGFIPHTIRYEKRDDRDLYILADNELLEISVVPVPANPDCLAKMKARALDEARERAAATHDAEFKARVVDAEPTNTTLPSTTERGTENSMDPKEALALVAAKDAEIAQIKATNDKAAADKAAADQRATAAEERAAKAEEEREAALETSKGFETTLTSVTKALTDTIGPKPQVAAGEAVAESPTELAARAVTKLIEADVEKYVGVKIDPAEKADFVELAKTNRPLFEKMIATRPDKKILGKSVIPGSNDTPTERSVSGADDGTELAELMDQEPSHIRGVVMSTDDGADLADLMG